MSRVVHFEIQADDVGASEVVLRRRVRLVLRGLQPVHRLHLLGGREPVVEHVDDEPALSVSERARLRELEREVRELRMKTEFLGKAAAFFAQEYR